MAALPVLQMEDGEVWWPHVVRDEAVCERGGGADGQAWRRCDVHWRGGESEGSGSGRVIRELRVAVTWEGKGAEGTASPALRVVVGEVGLE